MIPILFEDNHCLVVDKPAGLLAQGDATGDPSVVDLVSAYLKGRYGKPGNVFVGLVHRLDRPTSGVLLLARTSKAAGRLAEQFRLSRIEKTYLAVVEGQHGDEQGAWIDALIKDEVTTRVRSVPIGTPGSRTAALSYRVLDRSSSRTMFELKPTTGRGHQLRVQLSSRGLPIVGDFKYGARQPLMAMDGRPRIALHAAKLRFKHPTRLEQITTAAQVPPDWPVGWTSTRR